ncbi:unnamed protein product [Ilex paraguariensis]|uniref:Putative E3 ubiquitin-protein ligase LIN N-terminal domain-containing protein n=1 Tax=Ilex paraguariensis TaxID=185542 RepID=A0ABC8TU81_9AQUA
MSTTTTSAEILEQTTAFISETLSQSDLRHRLFSTFRHKTTLSSDQINLKPLNLAAETLENSLITTNPSVRSSSLRLAEKLLLSYPENPFSSFLLSLIYSLCHRPSDAALSLLDVFYIDPSLARLEIAPVVFEELFLIHFLPVLEWFNEQRSKILSSMSQISQKSGYESEDQSVDVLCTRRLSHMSGDQTSELKQLERKYEEVLDENCRAFAGYFKEVLGSKDENRLIDPPSVVLKSVKEGDMFDHDEDQMITEEESELRNGRQYGLMEKNQFNSTATGAKAYSSFHLFFLKGSP